MIILNSKLEDLDDRISEYESQENYPKKMAIKNGVCDDEFDPEDWICLEQGQPTSAIHNYLRAVRE